MKNLIALFILTLGVTAAAPAGAETTPSQENITTLEWIREVPGKRPLLKLHFFWASSCEHCARAKPFLEAIQERTPWLEVESYKIDEDPGHKALFEKFSQAMNIQKKLIPAFFMCGGVHLGYDRDETTGMALEKFLGQCYDEVYAGTAGFLEPSASGKTAANP